MDRKIGVYVKYDPTKEMWHPMPAEKCLVMDGEGLVHDSFVYGGQIGGYWFGLMDGSPAHLDQDIYRLAPLKAKEEKQREYEIKEMLKAGTNSTPGTVSGICEALHDAGYHNGPRMGDVSDEDISIVAHDLIPPEAPKSAINYFRAGIFWAIGQSKGKHS